MTGADVLVVFISIVFVFILSHINVDKEFPVNQKVGATIVMSLIAGLYLLFGVLI